MEKKMKIVLTAVAFGAALSARANYWAWNGSST